MYCKLQSIELDIPAAMLTCFFPFVLSLITTIHRVFERKVPLSHRSKWLDVSFEIKTVSINKMIAA